MSDTLPEVLQPLFDEFLETLDDEDCYNNMDTEKCIGYSVLCDFMTWLKNKKEIEKYEKMVS